MFNYIPITFIIEVTQENYKLDFSESFNKFTTLHKLLESSSANIPNESFLKKRDTELVPVLSNGKNAKYSRYSMPSNHFVGSNLWILKPTGMNRGNGIHVFKDITKLMQLINESLSNVVTIKKVKQAEVTKNVDKKANEESKTKEEINTFNVEVTNHEQQKDDKIKKGEEGSKLKNNDGGKKEKTNKVMTRKFIIQKYIESPLLIRGRKFDIRSWVLITHDLNAYLFKEGYIRTSSSPFVIDLNDVDNKFVHLTNNAVQKYDENYGKFEDGNQLSFTQFQDYIDLVYPEKKVSVSNYLIPKMKNIIIKSILATRRYLNTENRKYTFELFGYDFIVDSDFNIWLIEVNTNPCLEESSKVLRMLLPRMINDALKLTVDVIFPPPIQSPRLAYPVTNYNDQENMW